MSVFGRMTESVLTLLGEDAFLRTTVACKANIEHGVQLTGADAESAAYRGDLVVSKDVATIALRHAPKAGDTLHFPPTGTGPHAGKTYRLETRIEDNGFSNRFIVLELETP